MIYAPRLGWRDVPLRDAICEVTGLQVYVESAPIACALARLWSVTRTRTVNNFVVRQRLRWRRRGHRESRRSAARRDAHRR